MIMRARQGEGPVLDRGWLFLLACLTQIHSSNPNMLACTTLEAKCAT